MNTRKDNAPGIFISFEGGDGSGKSTQARLLAEHLTRCGFAVCRVHEPGGTRFGEKIRALLLGRELDGMTALSELLLYEAARAQLIVEVIEPALERGDIVICDRFTDSTVAYQGFGRELGEDLVRSLNELACNGRTPDRTILLTVDAKTAEQRVSKRYADGEGDRMESAGRAFRDRMRSGFDAIARQAGERVRIIETYENKARVRSLVFEQVADLFDGVPAPGEDDPI